MKYTDRQLDEAIGNNIFTSEQVKQFKRYVQNSGKQITKFHKVLYYGGGLLIISAMTWLMGTGWSSFGPLGTTIISALYFIVFLTAGYFVFFKKNMEVAGGLLFSIPIAITPLLVYSLLRVFDFWPKEWEYDDYFIWIRGKWIILEISALLVALPVFLKTKFPFHVFLMAVALWFFSMDIVPVLYKETEITWTERAVISDIFGLFMICTGYYADIKFKKDYSFWLYFFGLLTLSSGLSIFYNADTFKFIILGVINVLFIAMSIFLNRNVFIVFGTIGLTQFLGRLSWKYFEGSVLFPFALTIIGILLILSGMFFQKNKKGIEENIINKLPLVLIRLRPKRNI